MTADLSLMNWHNFVVCKYNDNKSLKSYYRAITGTYSTTEKIRSQICSHFQKHLQENIYNIWRNYTEMDIFKGQMAKIKIIY